MVPSEPTATEGAAAGPLRLPSIAWMVVAVSLVLVGAGWWYAADVLEREQRTAFEVLPIVILGAGVLLAIVTFAALRSHATAEARALAAARAVTAKLRDREARLQAILDSEPECVQTVGRDGVLLQMNPAGLAMIEAATADEVIGRSVFDLVHPDDREAYRRLHERALAGGEGHLRFRAIGRRGGLHWMETMSVPLRDGRDAITSVLSVTRDITERKRSEDMLVRTTAVLEAIFRAVPDLFFLLGDDGTILDFRGGADGDLYLPPTEFVGRRFQDVLPPSVAGTLADKFANARTTRQQQVVEYVLDTPGGENVFEARLLPLESGNVVVVARNVGQRVRAEEALRASEARYRQIVETAAEGIWIVDADGRTTFVNPRLAEMLRCPVEEILERHPFEFMDPEWQAIGREQLARRRAGTAQDRDFKFLRADGTEFWGIVSARTVEGEHGEYAGVLAMITDITDRRRSEEAHREAQSLMTSIVEHSPNMVFVKDAHDLRFVVFNRAGETLLGYTREEMIGRNDHDLFPESADFFIAKDREVLTSGRLVEIAEESIQTRNRGLRYLRTLKVPIVGEDGRPQYLLGIAEDITDRKALEGQLRQAQKMEAVGTLAGGIAHDFNNILTSILGFSELARADVDGNQRAMGSIGNVLEAGQRAKNLVEQLMAFSRQQEPERRPIDIGAEVASALRLLRPALQASITIRADIPPDLPVVLADATQIHQLVMNLGTNGAQAMPERRGVLEVTMRPVDVTPEFASTHLGLVPGRYVRLVVRDDGSGMDAATLERIFEPFFTTKKVGQGTGLGLPVVHGIVKSHGGAILVQSEPGRGTTVEVHLPAHAGPPADLPSEATVVPRGQGERILFVDDEVQLAELGRSMLESLGYRVTSLTDPIEAATMFRAGPNRFDLVVTDLTMPALSGTQLAQELWRVRPDIPVLLDTGFVGSLAPDAANMPGLRGVLAKPYTIGSLARAVHRALTTPA
ncbi:MAG TPA: PAS domain S-box protein [Candidatus Binatia bacterium]|jgi:PAS domain S-box-containing protein|nr:PAS domain S-box protein [Candidatus Binatia bacterium]